jgi:hypothetical protein
MFQLTDVKRIAVIVAAFGLAACVAAYKPPAGNTAYGTHPFKEVLSNANPPMTLEGSVLLLPDTVMMTLGGKSCSPDPANRSEFVFGFDCGEFNFKFSKTNPLRANSYRVPTTVWQMRQVCVATRTNPTTMAEICSRYGQERVETRVVLQGSLTFIAK